MGIMGRRESMDMGIMQRMGRDCFFDDGGGGFLTLFLF